jgi:hypothetical protein
VRRHDRADTAGDHLWIVSDAVDDDRLFLRRST